LYGEFCRQLVKPDGQHHQLRDGSIHARGTNDASVEK
jgi:hypothetical protein